MFFSVPSLDATSVDTTDGAPNIEIRTEYHPRSHKPAKVSCVKEAGSSAHRSTTEPWWPYFNTIDDFLLAEILLEGALSSELVERLIKLINRCMEGKGSLTFKGAKDIENAWEHVSLRLAPVS
jgi:hypothetical protein